VGGAISHGLPQPGESIGRYAIKRVVGVGGMGVVYEAHDKTLDRCVAIKLLRPDLLEGPSLLAEAQAMARLQHPNIVAVHDAGIANGQLYVCMEYVAGTTLRAWRTAAPRDWRSIARVYLAAGEGLAYVHRAGLVHLDFKPDNVLVDRDGRVRVTDFGLAHIVGARPRAIVGTPAYMAPEQRSGRPTDARCDQYAFCVSRLRIPMIDSRRWTSYSARLPRR
jgi:serine/threonine protein kinase